VLNGLVWRSRSPRLSCLAYNTGMKKILLVLSGLLLLSACVGGPATPTAIQTTRPTQVGPSSVIPLSTAQIHSTPMDERATPTAFHFPDSVSSDHIQHFTAYTSFKPVEIHMLDPRQGWSVAVDSGQDRHILRTQDSGQTWQDVTPPEPASAPRQNGKHLL